MDRHAWWFRRAIIRSVAFRCAVVALVGGVLVHLFVATRSGDAALGLFAGSLLVGQLLALGWFAVALVSNPLSYRYLRDHLAGSSWYEPVAAAGDPHPLTAELQSLGMRHPIRAVPTDGDDDGYELLVSKDGAVVAAVSRETGALSVMSRLSDGRIAHTAPMLVVPTERLVVNTCATNAPRDIVRSHANLLGDLAARGVTPTAATPRLWLDVMSLEREGYEQLGPVLGSLCNLDAVPALGRLMVTVPAGDVRALSVTPAPTSPQRRLPGPAQPPSRRAVADPSARPGAPSLDPVAG